MDSSSGWEYRNNDYMILNEHGLVIWSWQNRVIFYFYSVKVGRSRSRNKMSLLNPMFVFICDRLRMFLIYMWWIKKLVSATSRAQSCQVFALCPWSQGGGNSQSMDLYTRLCFYLWTILEAQSLEWFLEDSQLTIQVAKHDLLHFMISHYLAQDEISKGLLVITWLSQSMQWYYWGKIVFLIEPYSLCLGQRSYCMHIFFVYIKGRFQFSSPSFRPQSDSKYSKSWFFMNSQVLKPFFHKRAPLFSSIYIHLQSHCLHNSQEFS